MEFRKYLKAEDDPKEDLEVEVGIIKTDFKSLLAEPDTYEKFYQALTKVDKYADKLLKRQLPYKILPNNNGIYFELRKEDFEKRLKGKYKQEFSESYEYLVKFTKLFQEYPENILTDTNDLVIQGEEDPKQYGFKLKENLILVTNLKKENYLGFIIKEK